ncbi:molybdopterin-containing oxidoreductase family protein [Chitinasiproducens palmae]|nr:molybdopterin oxidoreductase family protein [Chitinasiproducens palmae]
MSSTLDRSKTVFTAVCPHDCPDTCALQVSVENGRAVSVKGDPDHPPTQGVLCTKVSRYPERTHHPERLTQPMRRIGRKGEGRFEPIGWEQAFSLIAEKVGPIIAREPRAVLPYSFAGTMGLLQGESIAARFFNAIGASQLDRTICAAAGAAALRTTYGGSIGMLPDFLAESRLILIWGSNPITSSVHFWARAQEAKRNGATLVAIDPYRSLTAEKCHQHIALKPGTDGALALGMIHVLLAEGLVDDDYIRDHTLGARELAKRAAAFTPERVADICGIAAETVVALARLYGTTTPTAIRLNYGMQRTYGGGNAARAIACLPSLTGAWRHRAGGLLLSTSGYAPVNGAALERPDLRPRGAGKPRVVNMNAIGDALLAPGDASSDPRIEALFVYNSNPVAVAPDSAKVVAGFGREDLFTVVLEHFQTDTADFADVLLPATTQLEHLDVHRAYGHTYVMLNRPAIAPVGESRPNTAIFRGIAGALGLTEPALYESDEDLARQSLRWDDPLLDGCDWSDLDRARWLRLALPDAPLANGGFRTPSGRCEFWSSALADAGLDPLPDYLPPRESAEFDPPLAARYPLAMISPPARNFLNSTFVNVDSLRASEREPRVDIHPGDASARGIVDGQTVRVFNDRGEMRARARVTDRARPGLVVGTSIWWRKLASDGRNANQLTSQALTDLGGSATFYDCLVEVAPVAAEIEETV